MRKSKEELVRFVSAGIVNTLFYYGAYAVLLLFGVSFAWAALWATLLGVCFSYFTFGKYVFFNQDRFAWVRFLPNYAFLYLLNIGIIDFCMQKCMLDAYMAGGVATLVCAVASFFSNKYFVFQRGAHE